ncbi:MAG: hypothetical protein KF819_13790 [Labilithrix sp.]|nr:hypothetical protein [Labilithrix sp.]
MQRSWIGGFAFACVGVAALVGCAEGLDADLGEGFLAVQPAEAGTEEVNSAVMPPPSQPPTEEEDAGAGDTDSGGGAADSGASDAGVDSGSDAGGGGTTSCASPNTCPTSTDLGSVSGDTGAGVKTAQGSTSQWFRVRVTEDDSDVFGISLAMKATLVSPAGTNFDLYLYQGGSSTLECAAVARQSTTTGTDTASLEFGESGLLSNGSDDSRNITVEVRHVSGTCSPSAKWSLTINGNTL